MSSWQLTNKFGYPLHCDINGVLEISVKPGEIFCHIPQLELTLEV